MTVAIIPKRYSEHFGTYSKLYFFGRLFKMTQPVSFFKKSGFPNTYRLEYDMVDAAYLKVILDLSVDAKCKNVRSSVCVCVGGGGGGGL